MREENWYNVYDYADTLTPGRSMKLEHTVSFNEQNAVDEMSELVKMPLDTLQAKLNENMEVERIMYNQARQSLNSWERTAAQTMLLQKAMEYVAAPAVKHTNNKWEVLPENHDTEYISNMVYKMWVHVYVGTRYDKETKESVPIYCEVNWRLHLNCEKYIHIAGQERKRYATQEEAMKYIAGRKKKYAHLFSEISPAIPAEYVDYFKVNGLLLPGYRVEENNES